MSRKNDVSKTFRLSPWKRFWKLELPAGAIGLVWNPVISVAGGWFFLISIESFELGNRDFRLPGLGLGCFRPLPLMPQISKLYSRVRLWSSA